MIHKLRQFNNGLWVMPSPDETPPGGLRRGRGVNALKTSSIRSRNGMSQLQDLNAHSIVRLNDIWYYGAGTVFYQGGTSKKTGLNGSRLGFTPMPPSPGMADSLFVTGGGSLFKINPAGTVENWGIDAPDTSGMTGAASSVSIVAIDDMETNAGLGAARDEPNERWQDADAVDSSGNGTSAKAVDTARFQEGAQSLKITAAASSVASVIYDYYTDNTNTELDLTNGGASLDTDFISFWIRMGTAVRWDYFQLDFSIGQSDFGGVIYSKRFVPDADADVSGVATSAGDLTEYTTKESERKWVEYLTEGRRGKAKGGGSGPVRMKRLEQRTVTEKFCALAITEQDDIWQQVKVAKNVFDKRGDDGTSAYNWSNVRAIRFTGRNNAAGGSAFWIDDIKLEGGVGLQGTYQYAITYRNSVTGNRSNAGSTVVMVEDVQKQAIVLSDIPTSSDSQVDQREIWRTMGGGVLFWLCDRIDDNTTTTYTDTVADPDQDFDPDHDVLEGTELLTDNAEPYSAFDDCAFHLGAAFWLDRSTSGRKGNVYYSPAGRVESMRGFIRVTNDDDPLQKFAKWNDTLYVWSESSIFRIDGSYPYTARKVYGCPGTTAPHTVAVSTVGVLYEGDLGLRLFNGMSSALVSPEALSGIFRGESKEELSSFTGVVAAAGKDEYFISDLSQTLAINLRDKTWRDLGIGLNALAYATDSKQLVGTYSSKVHELEKEGVYSDGGTAITFSAEPGHIRLSNVRDELVRRIHVDAYTNDQTISCHFIHDETVILIDSWTHAGRHRRSIPVGIYGRVIGVRITASLTAQIEIFGIDIEDDQGE